MKMLPTNRRGTNSPSGEKIGIVDELARAGVPFMAIAGGEPLVCKDFWPVVEYAYKRGIHLTVATNGTMITPEVAARLVGSGVKYVEVSVDSIRPEEHDDFRRCKVPGQSPFKASGTWSSRNANGLRHVLYQKDIFHSG